MEFSTPDGKRQRKGELNESTKFVAMMKNIQKEWYTLAKERVLKNTA